jgi:hypothetical protein
MYSYAIILTRILVFRHESIAGKMFTYTYFITNFQ